MQKRDQPLVEMMRAAVSEDSIRRAAIALRPDPAPKIQFRERKLIQSDGGGDPRRRRARAGQPFDLIKSVDAAMYAAMRKAYLDVVPEAGLGLTLGAIRSSPLRVRKA